MSQIILIGGSSSVGKTRVAMALGNRLGLEACSLDQYLRAIDDPALVFHNGEPGFWDQAAAALCRRLVGVAEAAEPYIRDLVDTWQARGQTGLIVGEQFHSRLIEQLSQVMGIRGVFIIEQDSERLYQTLWQRSQRFKDLSQAHRALVVAMDRRYGLWLRSQAEARKLAWTNAQPWATLTERVLERIQ